MVAPEALLLQYADNDARIGRLIGSTGPLLAPYDALVREPGWLLDPGDQQPSTPFDDPAADPVQRIVNALLVAFDYAVRRGATNTDDVERILVRESPVAIVARYGAESSPAPLARRLGITVSSQSAVPSVFSRRVRAHAELTIPCDPVLSFQPRTLDWDMGDNTISSFVVHNKGKRDGVTISGEVSERWGVQVGVPATTPTEQLAEIELEVAGMPCFLSGVTSLFDGQALEIGWAAGDAPEMAAIGECMHVWTKALFDFDAVEIRMVFARPRGRSVVLTDMRERARAFRGYRDAVISGHPDPESLVDFDWNESAGA